MSDNDLQLAELAQREEAIMSRTHAGWLAESELQEIYVTYAGIHKAYVSLSTSVEAIKRALFIQWYAVSDQNHISGINDLDHGAQAEVLDRVGGLVTTGNLDREFDRMLLWYFTITDFYFEFEWCPPFLRQRLLADKREAWRLWTPFLNDVAMMSAMRKRGQMGYYWRSMLDRPNGWPHTPSSTTDTQ